MTSERTCHFTGDDAWKCGTSCTCQHFNWNNKGQAAMTSELRPARELAELATRIWHREFSIVPAEDAFTALIQEVREAVRAEMRKALIATGEAAATHLKEAAKFKALAETLAGALATIHDNFKRSEEQGYHTADREFAISISSPALRQWEEARDAS